jgi:hypothetical protein
MASNHHTDSFGLAMSAPLKDLEFQPSTIETIDRAIYQYFEKECNIHTNSSKGWRKVPVIWVGAERAFQVKERKEMRDSGGMLVLPMIAIDRVSITKDPARKGTTPANLLNNKDEQGGVITVARRIKQDKTSYNRAAAQSRTWAGDEYSGDGDKPSMSDRFSISRQDGKVVYETITMPMPSRILVEYKVSIQTDFQQQMNEIIQAVHGKLGNHKAFMIKHEGHRYESFMDDFAFNNNLATLEEEDRVLKTEINIKVEGYLVGGGPNDPKPKIARRENAVTVALPRESVIIDGIPVPEKFTRVSSNAALRSVRRLLASAATRGQVKISTDGGSSADASEVILHTDYITQETVTGDLDGANTTFSLGYTPRSGTVTLILNGLVLAEGAENDYTISGDTVTMNDAPESDDRLVASYVKTS